MSKRLIVAIFVVFGLTGLASADPIEGKWRTQSGETASIASCGGSYCVTLMTGAHKGRQIGQMSGGNGQYAGTIVDPAKEKTYKGKATLSGATLKMSGCVMGGLICRSQNWSRQ